MSSEYIKKRRIRLMEKDPHCHWCRRLLKLYSDYGTKMWRGKTMPDDYPTIDHLKSRFFGKRRDVGMKEKTLVIACADCNNERNRQETNRYLFLTHWKSAAFPYPFRFLNRLSRMMK